VSRVLVDSAEAALRVAIAGGGIIRVGDMLVGEAIRRGQLKPVLTERHVAERVPLSAVSIRRAGTVCRRCARFLISFSSASVMLHGGSHLRVNSSNEFGCGS
jgi:DNA-binding transcriptional LysR family regulator